MSDGKTIAEWTFTHGLGQPTTIIPPVPKPDQTQLDCLESLPNTTSSMLHRWDEWHSH